MSKRMLVAAALMGVTLFAAAPKADAHTTFSFGIGLPGFTYYQSNVPPPAYYQDSYYPPAYYAPPAPVYRYYGDRYDGGYGYGRRHWRDEWRRDRRHCDR